jgi:Calcium binding
MRRKAPWVPGKQRLQGLVEVALVDAYDESEQRTAFFTMIEQHLVLPFEAKVLGVAATVERIDLTEAGEIVARCRRGLEHQSVPITELTLPKPPPAGAEWIEAYRYWARGH